MKIKKLKWFGHVERMIKIDYLTGRRKSWRNGIQEAIDEYQWRDRTSWMLGIGSVKSESIYTYTHMNIYSYIYINIFSEYSRSVIHLNSAMKPHLRSLIHRPTT